ncbi:MAG: hypothetical protein ABIO91_01620 [Pyrinomonadaceae bacterium]
MKLRIKGNSIRLRLLRSEVDLFATERVISEDVGFGGSVLRYSLRISEEADSIKAEFIDNEISVLVPTATALDWAIGASTGIGTVDQLGESEILSILIEKDFVCVDRPDDPDRDDAFPNPSKECGPD